VIILTAIHQPIVKFQVFTAPTVAQVLLMHAQRIIMLIQKHLEVVLLHEEDPD